MLWLAKGYALPASMYTSQIWGTRYMKQGAEMHCPLQGKVRFFKAVSAERGQLSRLWPPVRFEPRTYRLRGWIIGFPSQVPRRLLDYPELWRVSPLQTVHMCLL